MKKTKLFHSIIAFTLILSILFSMFVFGPVVTATANEGNTNTEEIEYWSGEPATHFAGGTGKKEDPYLIENGGQLYLMVMAYSNVGIKATNSNKEVTYFKLTNDIYLNNVTDADLENPTVDSWNAKGFHEWFNLDYADNLGFCGNFDGNGHTIYGLYANGNGEYAGLFPVLTDGANVRNVNLKNSFVTAWGEAGGIAGHIGEYWKLDAVNINNCSVDNAVITSADVKVGGLVGGFGEIKFNVSNCSVTNSDVYSTSTENTELASGLVGTGWGNTARTITNCFTDGSVHPVTATADSEKFNTLASKFTYTNVYTSAKENFPATGVTYLTEAQMQGDAAKTNMQGFDFLYQWKVVADNYPVPNQLGVWDGSEASGFAGGSGTKADPYLIENGAQFYHMVKVYGNVSVNTATSSSMPYFKITRDIILNYVYDADMVSPTAANWKAKNFKSWFSTAETKAGFYGELDGDGHTVYGFFTDGSSGSMYNAGLIPSVIGKANIKNLNLKNSFVYGKNAGCIVGKAYGSSAELAVDGCSSDNCYIQCWGSGYRLGGIVGGGEATPKTITITNCSATNLTFNNPCEYNSSASGKMPGVQSGMLGFVGSGSHVVRNCYTDATTHPVASGDTDDLNTNGVQVFNRVGDYVTYINVYTAADCPIAKDGVTKLTADQMKDEAAKTNMPGLDFKYDWVVVEDDYPVLTSNPIPVWNGNTVAPSGTGTKSDPFLIKNGENLAYIASIDYSNNKGLYFELTNDIRLNYTAGENWKEKAKEWKWYNVRFVGDFDGNGYTIDGLYRNTGHYRFALFSYVGDANLHDFNMTNAYINSVPSTSNDDEKVGAAFVAGQTSAAAVFERIYIDKSCYLSASNMTGVAGLVGRCNYKAEIKNCAVNGTITGGSQVGAFLGTGTSNASTILNSYTDTNLPLFGNPDGIFVTYVNAYSLADGDKYATKVNSAADMKGDAAKTSMPGLGFGRNWKIVENDYPQPVVYVKPDYVWDGTVADTFADDSSGTKDDPFIIENGAQLKRMIELYGNLTTTESAAMDMPYFKIVNDIYLNDVNDFDMADPTTASWDANGFNPWVSSTNASKGFYGAIDGGGHTIYGLYSKDTGHGGLIPVVVSTASVTNLRIEKSFVSIKNTGSYPSPAAIIGLVNGGSASVSVSYCVVNNCDILAAASTWRIGAVVGGGNGTCDISVSDCAVTNITMETLNNQTGYENRTCAFIGNTSGNKSETTVTNCYTDSSTHPVTNATAFETGYKVIDNNKTFTNVYTTATNPATYLGDDFTTSNNIIYLDNDEMLKGEAARTNMPTLVFGAVWETVENDYPVIVKNPIESWNGTKSDSFAGGSGTAEDPFLIENGGQLYKMVSEYSNMNVARKPADQDEEQPHFRITKDINLGNMQWYTHSKWSGDLTNANFTTGFNGVIEGDGHTIYGLFVAGTSTYSSVGLIPIATQGAQIHNLHLNYGNLSQTAWNGRAVGAFIGLAVGYPSSKSIIIDRCSVENFNIESKFGSAGLVGYIYAQSVSITNSYCKNTNLSVTATDNTQGAGAFIAVARGNSEGNKVLIENCYSDDVSSTIKYLDGGMDTVTSFNNVYTLDSLYDGTSIVGLNKVTATQLQGVNAKDTLNGFNFNQVWTCGEEGDYPVHKAYDSTIWNGREAASYAGGDGTAESPYEIANAEQLYKLANADTESTKGKYYKLTTDITISNIYDGWANDNPYTWAKKTAYLTGFTYGNSFAGTLDGDGHTITGLYVAENITDGGTYAYGLIPFISANSVVKNVNIDKVKIDVNGNAYVGAVVGAAYSKGNDATNPLANAQIVGANITNCDITSDSPSTTGVIFGGAVGGLKVELCNNEEKYDNVISYNAANLDDEAILDIRNKLLGKNNAYITDINAKEGFNVCDLLCAKKSVLLKDDDNSDEYELVWSQEFGGSELDYSVWSRNTTMSRGATIQYGDINNKDRSDVASDSLILSCEDTNTTNDAGNKIYNVNYGLDTMNSMSFKYGRLEMKAKIPFLRGAFPSLWLTSRGAIGNENITSYSTEIDIFEVFGNGQFDFESDLVSSTWNHTQMVGCIHKWYNDENGNTIKDSEGNVIDCSCGTSSDAGNNYFVQERDRDETFSEGDDNWHVIVFEWDENTMSFSVDGKQYYKVTRAELEGKFGLTGREKDAAGVFDQFLAVRLNNHMYSKGNGVYNYDSSTSIDASKLNYEIDYIKLEQKNDGKSAINLK